MTLNPLAIFIWDRSCLSNPAGQILNSAQFRLWIGRLWRGPKLPLLFARIGNPSKGTGVGRDLSYMGTTGVNMKLCGWAD